MGSPISQVAPSTQPTQGGKSGGLSKSLIDAYQQQIPPAQVAVPDGTTGQMPQGQPAFGNALENIPDQAKAYGLRSLAGQQITFPGQGGQPKMGMPNNYSNTVGQWDNATNQMNQTTSASPQQPSFGGGKGKG